MNNIDLPSLEEFYVAYIDILGYKQFFDDHPEKFQSLLCAIHVCFKGIKKSLKDMNNLLWGEKDNNGFGLRFFSDNLVIFCKNSKDLSSKIALLNLVLFVKDVQRIFMDHKLFIRGGITKGLFAYDENYVFGKALIDAVNIEEQEAKNPRIVIHEIVVNDIYAKYIFNDHVTSESLKKFEDVSKLFKTDTSIELVKRCGDICCIFCKIISEIPFVMPIDIERRLYSIQEKLNNIRCQINSGNSFDFEKIFKELKSFEPFFSSIFHGAAAAMRELYVKYENIISSSSCYFDEDDKKYVVDYLEFENYADIVVLLKPSYFKRISPEHDEIFASINLDEKSYKEQLRYKLSYHKRMTVNILLDDKEKYNKFIEEYDKYLNGLIKKNEIPKYEESVLKKHLWTLRYHNDKCKKQGFDDLLIECVIAIGKNSSIYVKEIGQHKLECA